jgi:hypothetical protein
VVIVWFHYQNNTTLNTNFLYLQRLISFTLHQSQLLDFFINSSRYSSFFIYLSNHLYLVTLKIAEAQPWVLWKTQLNFLCSSSSSPSYCLLFLLTQPQEYAITISVDHYFDDLVNILYIYIYIYIYIAKNCTFTLK